MFNKKGQAAMEFLMTYGWAILAAVIAIGVLAYFGVFTPGKYTSGTAIVTAPFYANAWNAKPAGVTLELQNNGGETFQIESVDITNCGIDTTKVNVTASSKTTKTVSCALTTGDNFKGDITITYRKSGSSVSLTATGTITEKVTA
ncbi:hypothetical protein J4456_04570 [Candidatus Pacearchaeota archaeon]|nr:hypothetical protein [Candidatus Pacearchaeota archaeon]